MVDEIPFISLLQSYAGIIGPIIGGLIAGIVGILITHIRENHNEKDRQKVVAKAFFEELRIHREMFDTLLSNFNTSIYDDLIKSKKNSELDVFVKSFLEEIEILNLGIPAPSITFIPGNSCFNFFYADIYRFNDQNIVQKLIQYHRTLVTGGRYFRNYFDRRCDNDYSDLRHVLKSIETARKIIDDPKLLPYLKRVGKVHTVRSRWRTQNLVDP